VLCAFDLLELDGENLRRLPIELRKAGLAQLLHIPHPGIAVNEHYVGHGDIDKVELQRAQRPRQYAASEARRDPGRGPPADCVRLWLSSR